MATLKREIKKLPSEQNLRLLSSLVISLANKTSSVEDKCISPWKAGETYQKDVSFVVYNRYIYSCMVTNNDDTFTESHWTKLADSFDEISVEDVKAFLNLTPEQVQTLSSIILDTEVRLDKTYSSSKIYTDIQDALKESKEYCLKQLASKSTGSFKKVNDTTEVTDGNYLYLILNPSTSKYDIYALVDSNVELLTSVDVNLDDYYTKTEVDNDFLKKTDAASTYATITTVDGKVDKTNVLTAASTTATDDQVYSAKAMNTELDGIVKKTDISTTIDRTSTNDTVPTNKAVYDGLINKVNNTIVLTTADEVNSFDMVYQSFIIDPSVAEAVGLPKAPDSTWFCINLSHFKGFKYPSQIAFEYAGIERIMYRTAHNGVWHNWRKIPTTSVADIDKTALKNTSTSYPNDTNSYYTIKNGWCQVSLSFKCTTAETTLVDVSTLPKPKMLVYAYGHPRNLDTDASKVPVFIFLTESGTLQMAYGSGDGTPYRASFSYPVAE